MKVSVIDLIRSSYTNQISQNNPFTKLSNAFKLFKLDISNNQCASTSFYQPHRMTLEEIGLQI